MDVNTNPTWELIINNMDLMTMIMRFLDTTTLVTMSVLNSTMLQLFLQNTQLSERKLREQYLNESRGDLMDSSLIDFFSCLNSSTTKCVPDTVTSISEFRSNLKRLVCSKRFEDQQSVEAKTIAGAFLSHYESVLCEESPFVLSGGLIIAALKAQQSINSFRSNEYSDLDVFSIANRISGYKTMTSDQQEQICDRWVRNVTIELYSEWKTPYITMSNGTTLEFFEKNHNSRPLQFILRKHASIEHLLHFFDMDCVKFAYDGKRVLTTRSGLRSLITNINTLSNTGVSDEYRMYKFQQRGYTILIEPYHPLHEFNFESNNWIDTYLQLKPKIKRDHILESVDGSSLNIQNRQLYCETIKCYDRLTQFQLTNYGTKISFSMHTIPEYRDVVVEAIAARNITGVLGSLNHNLFKGKPIDRYKFSHFGLFKCWACETYFGNQKEHFHMFHLPFCATCGHNLSVARSRLHNYMRLKNILIIANHSLPFVVHLIQSLRNHNNVLLVSPSIDLKLMVEDFWKQHLQFIQYPSSTSLNVQGMISEARMFMGDIDVVFNFCATQLVQNNVPTSSDEYCLKDSSSNKRRPLSRLYSKRRKLNSQEPSNTDHILQARVVLDAFNNVPNAPDVIVNMVNEWNTNDVFDQLVTMETESEGSGKPQVITCDYQWVSDINQSEIQFAFVMWNFLHGNFPL